MKSRNKPGSAARLVLLCLLISLIVVPAEAEIKVEMLQGDWTWEAGGFSVFTGSITSDQDLSDVTLSLTAETLLEQSGQAIFTSINGKRLKVKKQLPTASVDLVSGAEIPFEAEWDLPEDTGSGLTWVRIHLSVLSPEGSEISSGTLDIGSLSDQEAMEESAPTRIADRVIICLLAASAFVWLLAAVRSLLLKVRNRKDQ